MTDPITDIDVPPTQFKSDLRLLVARQRVQARVERLGWLIAHPELAVPATAGERAEMRHLLYDADDDASVPAFPYPTATPLEAS